MNKFIVTFRDCALLLKFSPADELNKFIGKHGQNRPVVYFTMLDTNTSNGICNVGIFELSFMGQELTSMPNLGFIAELPTTIKMDEVRKLMTYLECTDYQLILRGKRRSCLVRSERNITAGLVPNWGVKLTPVLTVQRTDIGLSTTSQQHQLLPPYITALKLTDELARILEPYSHGLISSIQLGDYTFRKRRALPKTVHILGFNRKTSKEEIKEVMRFYGSVMSTFIIARESGSRRALVKFHAVEDANSAVSESLKYPGILLRGRRLDITHAYATELWSYVSGKLSRRHSRRNRNT